MNATTMYYNKAFDQYIRNKATVHTDRDLEEGYREEYDSYDFPRGFDGDYAAALAEENLFRRYATLVHTTPGDMKIQTIESTAEAVLCDERMAYDEQADSFDTAEFGAFKLASLAKLRREFVADQHFDLQAYLRKNFCRRFGRAEERLLLTGTGVDQPTGLLTSAVVGATASDAQIHSYEFQEQYWRDKFTNDPDRELVGIYADRGISGNSIKKRDQFQAMMQDARDGKLDVIYTKSVSRFARNTVDLLDAVRELRDLGVEVVFEKENISTFQPASELYLTIAASIAENELQVDSERQQWSVRHRYENGWISIGHGMCGYRMLPDNTLEIVPEQAEII